MFLILLYLEFFLYQTLFFIQKKGDVVILSKVLEFEYGHRLSKLSSSQIVSISTGIGSRKWALSDHALNIEVSKLGSADVLTYTTPQLLHGGSGKRAYSLNMPPTTFHIADGEDGRLDLAWEVTEAGLTTTGSQTPPTCLDPSPASQISDEKCDNRPTQVKTWSPISKT